MKRNTAIKRYTPLKRTPLFRGNRKPIPKVSSRRRVANRIYSVNRKELLTDRPTCEVCVKAPSCDVHHKAGRLAGNLNNEATWLAVCRDCHDWIHQHPSLARAQGLLV